MGVPIVRQSLNQLPAAVRRMRSLPSMTGRKRANGRRRWMGGLLVWPALRRPLLLGLADRLEPASRLPPQPTLSSHKQINQSIDRVVLSRAVCRGDGPLWAAAESHRSPHPHPWPLAFVRRRDPTQTVCGGGRPSATANGPANAIHMRERRPNKARHQQQRTACAPCGLPLS